MPGPAPPPPPPAVPAAVPPGSAQSTKNSSSISGVSNRIDILDSEHGRILCLADIRGAISQINELAKLHNAVAVIHSGDFGFYEPSSLDRISDRTLRHLIQYSSLISTQFRSQLLAPSMNAHSIRQMIRSPPQPSSSSLPPAQPTPDFALSEFPDLLSGKLKLDVPVYTVWGACEDVSILEKIRAAGPSVLNTSAAASSSSESAQTPERKQHGALSAYSIPNLTVLDEATTRCIVLGGIRLRLFGLGGAVVPHKLFDNGEGGATIAGGQGTMWTSILQIGEVVDTAQRVYDPSETRLLISHASPGREGLLAQLALVLKADLTISAGLHFRYGVSYNEFSVQHDQEAFRAKLLHAKATFNEIWDTVKNQVDEVIDEHQRQLLSNALAVANRVPAPPPPGSGTATEEPAWKNSWNWNLPDAAYGSLILDIKEGRIGAEMRSQGFNFAYRAQTQSKPPTTPSQITPRTPIAHISQQHVNGQGSQNNGRSSNQYPNQQHRSSKSREEKRDESPRTHNSTPSTSGPVGVDSAPKSTTQAQSTKNPSTVNQDSTGSGAQSASPAPSRKSSFTNKKKKGSTGGQSGGGSKSDNDRPIQEKSESGETETGTTTKNGTSTSTSIGSHKEFKAKIDGGGGGGASEEKIDSGNDKLVKSHPNSSDSTPPSTLSNGGGENGNNPNSNFRGRSGPRGSRGGQGQYNTRNNRGGRGAPGSGRGMDRDGFNSRPAGPGLVGPALAGAGIGNKSSSNNLSSAAAAGTNPPGP
ncbi:hypothetical protein Pst134EA_031703 [Puccinia striiformis f. sp. tritici]|uniref:uncharacterized protein n=1 Tax=Puccinia striiformis f. sp. tritici TaxID=168172 RepID=UPI0020081561|nr:uncharacterized protein Pst134EA_031703 [Puccinia striiformis f. sp. tritici]KAH9442640.1 hypothetical protein Pst134EA_031703 [Puccinia striiformis f. sp. tritici]